jgi:hypothetical protein
VELESLLSKKVRELEQVTGGVRLNEVGGIGSPYSGTMKKFRIKGVKKSRIE